MSYYYKYNFISPESVFSTIKEEFKSYFDTGAVDDLLFPTYLNKCLNKLGKSSYMIVPEVLFIEDYEARLPDNFFAVREAWLCTEIQGFPYQEAGSFYSQSSSTTIQIAPMVVGGQSCDNPICRNDECTGCLPEIIQAVYKTNVEHPRSYRRSYLLKPGNISAKENCSLDYSNNWNMFGQDAVLPNSEIPFSGTYDSFDIRDNKFVTNFRTGVVHLLFYAEDYDNCGNQLMPDNYRIKEFIEAFIKYKIIEQLTNQTNDETFNQLQQKLVYYKQLADEAYIMAESEIKKQDAWTKQRRIKQSLNRFGMYELKNNTYPYRRR